MKTYLSMIVLGSLFLCQPLKAQEGIFKDFNTFYSLYVHLGKVKYDQIQYNRDLIELLVKRIGEQSLNRQSDDFKAAFYINAYNLLTIYQIVENYPGIQSVMDIHGFFKGRKFLVAGNYMTLDELEFKGLFEIEKDPRYHFALVCGAQSCPLLYNQAFVPEQLDKQLDARARVILNFEDYVDSSNGQLSLFKVMDWYRADFAANKSLIAWINDFRDSPIAEGTPIVYAEYDWKLNKAEQ
ncbi:MAG: DUF547 domain-containing protein [Cytophagales bacterium]|nr:DUF547 domain-containing protein [Cytophagales bacterium]